LGDRERVLLGDGVGPIQKEIRRKRDSNDLGKKNGQRGTLPLDAENVEAIVKETMGHQ